MSALPPASIWLQFTIIAIIVLVISLLGIGLYKGWKEFTDWLTKQNSLREKERQTQRDWESAEQTKRELAQDKRDEVWRAYFTKMQTAQDEQRAEDRKILGELVTTMKEHDNWARKTLGRFEVVEGETPITIKRRK